MLELIQRLEELGLAIRLNGDRLRVSPAAGITTEIRTEIEAHREELVQFLQLRGDISVQLRFRDDVARIKYLNLKAESSEMAEAWRRAVATSIDLRLSGIAIGEDALLEDISIWDALHETAAWPPIPEKSRLLGYVRRRETAA